MRQKNKLHINSPEYLSEKEQQALENALRHFGYLLPTNDAELEEFEKIFGTTKIMRPEHLKDLDSLFKKNSLSNNKLMPVKKPDNPNDPKKKVAKAPIKTITANAYFKKLVLAAEITTQLHMEYSFGHIKFVKVQYLCDQLCNMQLDTNYRKFAAGPFDPKLIRSIDAEFKKRKWFSVTLTKYGYKYAPDINANEYKKYYSRYFSEVEDKINYVINLFRKEKSDFCEIVATLFAVWDEQLTKKKVITNPALFKAFYAWSEEKKRFKEPALINAIAWMKDNNIVPIK